jgi:proteasome lid subunit RPN8/RPN11
MEDAIRIPREILHDMIDHAREGKPEEVCGILSGRGNRVLHSYRAANVADDPVVTYDLAPKDQYRIFRDIDERGEDLLAIYHSHPASPAYPSATDLRLAFYPDAVYVILSLAWPERPIVRAYRLADGTIREIRVEELDGE